MLVVVLILMAVVAASAVMGELKDRGYRRELRAWVAIRGWAYRENGGGEWGRFLPDGRKNGVKFQLDGTRQGRPVTLADYWYETAARLRGGPRLRRHLTVVAVRLAAPYPPVALRSRALGRIGLGIAQAVGLHPENLTGIPEFDRRFQIEAGPHGGRELVTAQVIQATLQGNLPSWHLDDQDLVIVWPGSPSVRDFDRKLSQALALAAQLDQSS